MSEEEAPPIYDSDPNEDTSWLVTYGDMVTLLMVFFVLMLSASKINEEKRKLEVMVKIFGRKTPLELSYMQVEKL